MIGDHYDPSLGDGTIRTGQLADEDFHQALAGREQPPGLRGAGRDLHPALRAPGAGVRGDLAVPALDVGDGDWFTMIGQSIWLGRF